MKKSDITVMSLLLVTVLNSPAFAGGNPPEIGKFGHWMRLESATLGPGQIGGIEFSEVATYRVKFNVMEYRKSRQIFASTTNHEDNEIRSSDPSFQFCGRRVDLVSGFRNYKISFNSITSQGLKFTVTAQLEPILDAKAGVEGYFEFRYVNRKAGEPVPNCDDGAYVMKEMPPITEGHITTLEDILKVCSRNGTCPPPPR